MSDEFTLPIHEHDGITRKLGLTLPDESSPCVFSSFEDQVATLDGATLRRIAQSGERDMRGIFGVDWITDQGTHGSCNGFSEAEVLRKAIRRTGVECPPLSGSYAYSLMNGNRDNGSNLNVAMDKVAQSGICLASTVGLDQIYRSEYDTARADAEAATRKGFEAYAVGTLAGFWTALALGWDVVFAIDVGRKFNQLSTDGFPGVSNGNGNHAMSADGLIWVAGEIAACGVNHWTTNWGIHGRCNIAARNIERTLGAHVWYAIRSAVVEDDGVPTIGG